MPPTTSAPPIVARDDELLTLAREAAEATRLAVDLEASGMFAYRARICTVQLAWEDRIVVVDALSARVAALSTVLGVGGPVKIVHDVAFDARLLAETGIELGNVHDTSLMARMLGRKAVGLSALLESELGVTITKDLQHHDWRERPIDGEKLTYLAQDVAHLPALEAKLWTEVEARGIAEAVLEETRYRIACAIEGARTPQVVP
jgi:ribonuclease D